MFSDEIFQKLSFTFLLGFGFVCVRFERNLADSAVQKCFKSACTQRPQKKGGFTHTHSRTQNHTQMPMRTHTNTPTRIHCFTCVEGVIIFFQFHGYFFIHSLPLPVPHATEICANESVWFKCLVWVVKKIPLNDFAKNVELSFKKLKVVFKIIMF